MDHCYFNKQLLMYRYKYWLFKIFVRRDTRIGIKYIHEKKNRQNIRKKYDIIMTSIYMTTWVKIASWINKCTHIILSIENSQTQNHICRSFKHCVWPGMEPETTAPPRQSVTYLITPDKFTLAYDPRPITLMSSKSSSEYCLCEPGSRSSGRAGGAGAGAGGVSGSGGSTSARDLPMGNKKLDKNRKNN